MSKTSRDCGCVCVSERVDNHPHGRDIPRLTAPPPPLPPSSLLPESPDPFFSGTDAELGVSSHCFRQHFRSTGEGSPKQNTKQNTPLAAHVGALKGRAPERSGSYVHVQTHTRVCAELRQPYCVWSTSFQPWKKVSHKSPTKSTSV